MPDRARRFVAGALVLGFGLGGLADGIVLHQVLQWHNLVSAQVTNQDLGGLQENLFWDGVFHLSATVVLLIGIFLLRGAWEDRQQVTGNLADLGGLALLGWGAFHAVDQILFHELLNLHNIREGVASTAIYNWGFLAVGVLLALVGWLLVRSRGALWAERVDAS